ncbi:uncharacterized protein TRAVEDRAFT_53570 [Trametes versicolor FP-101664 SS1]|uniref:uncharacterized protein n=1 Tax=Trametes versicolor (strain FP-101664) TaxID=717944 RepID=UPI00046247C9|nr:uncharacterized protein TRAVEDRAFT_53570 [Trametes versicolor FP-101664 SS1]EIW52142.1 hypothetical protein TRAVEDRAFT_53570 [Trametes versicolor FP-101664 SS1]
MASLPQILKVPSLDSSLGAVLLGVIFGSMLYGLTVHQTYRYFKLYPKDRLFLKALVLTILVFETLHTAVWIVVIYHYAITDAFNLIDILRGHWSVRFTFLITGLAVFACQVFYVRRVFLIGPHYRWLVVPADSIQVISMFGGLSFAVAAGIEAFLTAPFVVDLQHISWLVSIAYGFAVATDVILTSALVFVLRKSRTGSKSVIGIMAFIFAIVIPGNLIYAAVSIVGAKLYANSVLAVLNSRRSIDNRFLDDFTSFSLEALATSVPSRQPPQTCRMDLESMVYNVPEGVGSYRPENSLRMDPGLRNSLLLHLQTRYEYRDGDFECDTRTSNWVECEGPEKWEQKAASSGAYSRRTSTEADRRSM